MVASDALALTGARGGRPARLGLLWRGVRLHNPKPMPARRQKAKRAAAFRERRSGSASSLAPGEESHGIWVPGKCERQLCDLVHARQRQFRLWR
jgi:hypothetical protein